ncbi:MAG: DUF4290 domain-containing protein [Flavobacteriales bacterium]|nr:DUF4290 domain-containing protein [Flavobacteriales bacterium]
MTNLEYNSTRPDLSLPEYGRNVQRMVNFCMTVEDKGERNKVAQAIIKVMGQLNPHLRDVEDYTHKLWDHLYIMSDFQLDVDSPYPIPERETFQEKPARIPYPSGRPKYGHYGKAVQGLIKKATEIKDPEEKKYLINLIVNLMKRFYLTWNRDSVRDEVIIAHVNELSDGKLNVILDDVVITATSDIVIQNKKPKRKGSKGSKSGPKGSKGKRNDRQRRRY